MTPALSTEGLAATAARAAHRAANYLAGLQSPQGYWWGELTADTTLESDAILLELWLHPPRDGVWNPPDRPFVDRAVRSILARQRPDGGFNIYHDGPAEVSATVKAYFALKVAGVPPDAEPLAKARERILELGGLQAANSYVKLNLSLFGLYPREHCPAVPPEIALLPGNFLYRMSSWTRAIVVALAIVHSANPTRPVPAGFTLDELLLPGAALSQRGSGGLNWPSFFHFVDRLLKRWDRKPAGAIRQRARKACERWMLERLRCSDGLGAIYPPMMYAIMALDVLGYQADHPERVEAERQFRRLLTDDGKRFFFQPCFSPVWDTAIAVHALGEAGFEDQEALRRAADWLLAREVRRRGDWSVMRPKLEPSGWSFEFANEFYPDIDDTGMVLLALQHARSANAAAQEAARRRALDWLLGMQSRDGGWAAFDADNDWKPLSYVPFADHNAMLDPTCPDITGRVLETVCRCGSWDERHPAVARAVAYLRRTQEADGSWYGRWGVNYLYGTFLALRGLQAAGVDDRDAAVLRAGEWLRATQNSDGGWGESCASYDQGCFVAGPSTASQTAWALLGLFAGGDSDSLTVQLGMEWLIRTQREDGSWWEEHSTGTGFPRVFYLTYHLYRQSFPLLALGQFAKARNGRGE